MPSLKCPACGKNNISIISSTPDPKASDEMKDTSRKAAIYFLLRTLAGVLLGILALEYFIWRWEILFQEVLLKWGWLHTLVNTPGVKVGIVVIVGLILWFVPAPMSQVIRHFKIKRAMLSNYHCLDCGHKWKQDTQGQ